VRLGITPDFLSIGPFTGDVRLDRLFDSVGRLRGDLAGMMATGAIFDAGIRDWKKRKKAKEKNGF
jgi:hypothetical protein